MLIETEMLPLRHMGDINIKLDGVAYSVRLNENGTYRISGSNEEVLTLKAKVAKNLMFEWKTEDGDGSPLIEKIGLMIETHDLKF
jgi:hypothetical protein